MIYTSCKSLVRKTFAQSVSCPGNNETAVIVFGFFYPFYIQAKMFFWDLFSLGLYIQIVLGD